MSHLLQVWESPQPSSVADARTICQRLQREGAAPSQRFARLAASLTARHPDIDADDTDDGGVWTDGPLAANGRGAVFGIGIRAHAAPAVVPFVVATAGALGLVVLDDESGLVYLPDGRVLGQRAAVPAPTEPPAALTRGQVLQALQQSLAPQLEAAGLRAGPDGRSYVGTTAAARVRVSFDCETREPKHTVSVYAELALPGTQAVALLQVLAPGGTGIYVQVHAVLAAAGLSWPEAQPTIGAATDIETAAQLQQLCVRWQHGLAAALVPLLERCSSLRGLEQVLNEHPGWFSTNLAALVMAAAVGRPDLPALAAGVIRTATPPWHDQAREWLHFLQSPATVDLGPPLDDAARVTQAWPCIRHGRPVLPPGDDGLGPAIADLPVFGRFVGMHYLVYGVDQGDATGHVQQRHLAALRRTPQDLHAMAMATLAARAEAGWHLQTEGPIQRLRLDGRHDASLLALEALWQGPLARQAPNGALIAIPTASELVFCDVAAAGGLASLRARVAQRKAEGATVLSETVFFRAPGKLEALPPPRSGG